MKRLTVFISAVVIFLLPSCIYNYSGDAGPRDSVLISDTIQYHPVRINLADGSILPWFSADRGVSYDTCIRLVWNFWNRMETDSNGLKYYMNHQVWRPEHDMRGLGGDQINMALSSWALLYAYTGNRAVLENMKYMADEYIGRSLADGRAMWPFIPYPYNTEIHSGVYDGDMRNGKGITQPDKAGTFGYELINLWKITGDKKYFAVAKLIGTTLESKITAGDDKRSPLPFRVNAETGQTGMLFDNSGTGKTVEPALYTTNWTGTMMLFEELAKSEPADSVKWMNGFRSLLDWMKDYPLKTNKWGPFFEDIPGWSDTQTNAITFAWFIMNHREYFPEWQSDVKGIIDWTYRELGNNEYNKYKVTVMNEQTAYRVPGNSHTSRQASVELMYSVLSGDNTYTVNAIRALDWATYTVATDGRNRYIRDDIWLTDGYGDYVRHYLRALYWIPELASFKSNAILGSTSLITSVSYDLGAVTYTTSDNSSYEKIVLVMRPGIIAINGTEANEMIDNSEEEGWIWTPSEEGGILEVIKKTGKRVDIIF
jgi:hypothetical protein